MSSTLGQKLRQAREERGISISEVAEQTRISSLYLESIEKDNYKPLPGGIFNKGFVKSYAKYVGFDEQEALQEYGQLVADLEGIREDDPKIYRPEVLTDDRSASSFLPTIIFAGIILALMTAGILFLVNYIQQGPSEPEIAANNSNAALGANSNGPSTETQPQQAADAPTMANLKVEFVAIGDTVSLGSVNDGRKSDAMIVPGTSVVFEPKQSLKLKYSKSRVPFAQLKINGKPITLPTEPAIATRSTIEFDINDNNLAQIWESGQIQYAADTSEPEASPPVAQQQQDQTPSATPRAMPPVTAATPVPRPAATVAAVPATRPRVSPTPIIVRSANRNSNRPPN